MGPGGIRDQSGIRVSLSILGCRRREKGPEIVSSQPERRTPWLLWPFVPIWRLLTWILQLTGRLIAAVLGLVLMIVGLVLVLTVVAAPIGIPMLILGFLLMIRAIF